MWADTRFAVAGYGLTGRAVAKALAGRVGLLRVIADDPEADFPMPDDDASAQVVLTGIDVLVTSPGIPPSSSLLTQAAATGIPIWSEVELAWRLRGSNGHAAAKWLVVTGTNGKTTTVGMLESILIAGGERARAVGNVGPSLVEAVLEPDLDVLAIELSSFQLHYTQTMTAQAAALLNVAADHLDWHGGFENYAADKGKVFSGVEIAGIYNVADPITERLIAEADVAPGARAVGFTLDIPQRGMVGVVDDLLIDRAFHLPFSQYQRERSADELATFADLAHLSDGPKPAPHIVANALAAAALARAHGTPLEAVAEGLRRYNPPGHRIAKVATVKGVTYVDDSKATNAHAAAASLQAFPPGTVVWIAGGLAKGANMSDLVKENAARMRGAVVIGKDQIPFMEALTQHAPNVPIIQIDPRENSIMESAVTAAAKLAQPGDTVLLAPAGASQDQFVSYAERGEAFCAAVKDLR
ncbi:MAG: UDP-N-acetylmuramoyl-L-alanine--D-glutamate ligase [Promicromonosporaceae bacterium]|nr:UDP-N-acetylmuramoyl-L-alanine--D-glutamate ligase [Promicromonosporaceae bacterium]